MRMEATKSVDRKNPSLLARIARSLRSPYRSIVFLAAVGLCIGAVSRIAAADSLDPTAPSASFTVSPDSPFSGDTVTFTSTSTAGLLGGTIQSEDWDLNNDGVYDDANGSQVQHSFGAPGTYPVGLQVTDSNGATATAAASVVVHNRLPSAAFTASPSSPSTLQNVTFTSTSTDADGSIASYSWDLDNDGNFNDGSSSQAERSFPFAGTYTVKLRVTDDQGDADVAEKVVSVGNQDPVASFGYTPLSPASGDTVTFTSTSTDADGTIATYAWDLDNDGQFDDGAEASAQKPFATPGNHTVRLKVTDNDGASNSTSLVVNVANRAPMAGFDFSPQSPKSGDQVTFTSSSTDPDGSIASYAWDTDNDGQFDDGTGSSAQKAFATPGTYTVKLRVTDGNGATDVATHTVDVANRAPQAAFGYTPSSPKTGDQITFTSGSTDADGSIVSYSWDLNGDDQFGDSGASTAQASFATPGSHTVKLQVTDNSGATDVASVTVQVGNRAPTAAFGFSPQTPGSGDQITFTSTSTDPDGSIASYAWDTDNDGQFDNGSSASTQATFAKPGSHPVKLRVTDNNGATDTATVTVQVANRGPSASFSIAPQNPKTGDQVTFTSTSTDPDGSIAGYAWDLDNDGQFDDGTGASATKTFATAGTYTVKLRVTDNSAATATATLTVDVANRPPSASFTSSPGSPKTGDQVTFTSTSTDPDGTIASVAWDFDNDGNFNDGAGSQAQASFALPGPHTVRVLAVDNNGALSIASGTVQIANRPPAASFTVSPAAPKTAEQITFTSTSTDPDGSIASYAWDLDNDGQFDDGTAASAQASFATPGAKTVKLRVTDNSGGTTTQSVDVPVANRPPVASFGFTPAAPKTAEQITFTSTSTDPDGTVASYAWDTDNDGQFDDGTAASATKAFATPGTYTVKLRVTDNSGGTTTQSVDVPVANRPPVASFGFTPAAPKTADQVTFTSTSTDPDGSIASYAWDTDNNGQFDNGNAASVQASFATPGSHAVQLRVTDSNGATDVKTLSVDVVNRPPVASFGFAPAAPKTLEPITFTSTSTDPDGTIASYAWDLDNDGQFDDGTGASAQRAFPVTNTYTVKLRVTDANGATDTATKTLTPLNQPPVAAFTTSPAAPTTDGPVTFTSASTDPEGLPLTAAWDLDNNGSFEATGATAQKQYTIPGTYPFKLRVIDASAISDVATGTITIPNRPPTASLDHSPKNPQTSDLITFTPTYNDPEKRVKAISWDSDNDGAFDDGATPTLTKSYKKPGPYTVRFQVEDQDGAKAVAEDVVAVGNQPPKASFVVLPESPVAGSTFTLVSTAIDPDTALDRWLWDLNGDGVYDDAEGPEVKFSIATAGSYTVGLKVVDSEDLTDAKAQTVVVQPPPPPALATPAQLGTSGPAYSLLTPFPVVRLAGRISKGGTRLRLFAVDAPTGARVVVMCKGRSCPFRLTARSAGNGDAGNGKVHASSSLRIKQLEKRVLKKGVSITIFVTKPGTIGKYVQFQIRKGRPPARIDRCLMPTAPTKPVQCPS